MLVSNGRPVAGYARFNTNYLDYSEGKFKNNVATFVHEVFHAIFFHPWLFENKFPPNSSNQSFLFLENNQYKIRGDNILSQIRNHFSCPTVTGAPLENGGGSGSAGGHFEKLVFADDTMVPDDTLDARTSKMSLAVAKDSGWYEVDLGMGEHYTWAKGEGCSVFDSSCDHVNVSEFCSASGHYGCSDDHMYKTLCQTGLFIGNCPINLQRESCVVPGPTNYTRHTRGASSVCLNEVITTNKSAGCYKVECSADGTSYEVVSTHSGSEVRGTCSTKGTSFTLWNSTREVVCEDPAEICKTNFTICPDDCNHRGVCLDNGTCECYPWYEGSTCGTYIGCRDLNLTAEFCTRIEDKNHIERTNITNSGDGSGGDGTGGDGTGGDGTGGDGTGGDGTGGDGTDDERSLEAFQQCKSDCIIEYGCKGYPTRDERRTCKRACRDLCIHLKPLKNARYSNDYETSDGSVLENNINHHFKFISRWNIIMMISFIGVFSNI